MNPKPAPSALIHPTPPLTGPVLDTWLANVGLRRTKAARAVLQLFAGDCCWSATHAEVEAALAQQVVEVNRVTVYRLLDRLASVGLLVRHADHAARTWRYTLAPQASEAGAVVVPRFECDACHRQIRLTDVSPPTQAVADELLKTLASLGHQGQRVDLSIHGTCNVCVDPSEDGAGVPA